MNHKRIGVAVAVTTVIATLAGVFLLDHSGHSVSFDAQEDASPKPEYSGKHREHARAESSTDDSATKSNNRLAQTVLSDQFDRIDSEQSTWETYLLDIDNSALDAMRLQELTADDLFDEFLAELRNESSEIAVQVQGKYEILFYSTANSRDGTVVLDAFECGIDLCAMSLRSDNDFALGDFMAEATKSELFEARAIMSLPGSEIYSSGVSRRVVFSHNPSINAARIPAVAVSP